MATEPIIVFFSWQSDHSAKISRQFLIDAMNSAIETKFPSDDFAVEVRPEDSKGKFDITLDHDTKGEVGFIDIFDTIKKKIDRCDHFVADLTPVGRTVAGKALQNPNVMLELGYALTSKSSDQITVIANGNFYVGPEDLPFDISGRRQPITYKLSETSVGKEINSEKIKLVRTLNIAFKNIVKLSVSNSDRSSGYLESIFGEYDSFNKDHLHGLFGYNRKGSKVRIGIPHAPFSYMKIITNSSVFQRLRNSILDPLQKGAKLNLGLAKQAGAIKTHQGFVNVEYEKMESKIQLHTMLAINASTATIHFVDFRVTRLKNGEMYHGRTFSESFGYEDCVDQGYIDLKIAFNGWLAVLEVAEEVLSIAGLDTKVSIEAGISSQRPLRCTYDKNSFGRIAFPTKEQLVMDARVTPAGRQKIIERLGEGISDTVGIPYSLDTGFGEFIEQSGFTL